MDKFKQLRRRAQEIVKNSPGPSTTQDIKNLQLLHELDTYRIELELQYNELQATNTLLQETHNQLQKTHYRHYEIAPVGYLSLNRKSLILEVNQTLASMLVVTKIQLLNNPFTDFIHPSDQDIFYLFQQALSNTQKFNSCELRLQHPSKNEFWVKLDGVYAKNNQTHQLNIAISDISALKTLEKDLQLDSNVFDECSESIMVTDVSLTIIKVNKAFSIVTGYLKEEAIGKKPSILQSGIHEKSFYQQLWSDLNEQHYWKGEIWNKRKDGEIYPEWMTITAVTNSDNQVLHYIGVFSDITQLKISMKALEKSKEELQIQKDILSFQANHDALTQLPNRLLLMDRLEQSIKKAHRNNNKLAVMFIDLDHFKKINDSLGHNIGDEVLKESATRLKLCIRDTDTVARLGGDEFTVIIEEVLDNDIIIDIAHKINRTFQEPFAIAEQQLYVTSSIGISLYPLDANSAEDLLRNADAAMYKAKNDNRNTYRFYTEDMTQRAFKHIQIETSLHHALDNKELTVYYQPQVDGTTDKIIGMEALVRWLHPDKGVMSPAQFIPLAEKTGIIIPLGEYVFDMASKQMAYWKKGLNFNGRMAINLSVKQFQQAKIVEFYPLYC